MERIIIDPSFTYYYPIHGIAPLLLKKLCIDKYYTV